MERGSERVAEEERLRAVIAEEFPGTDVHRVWGAGYQALPKGTPQLWAVTIGGLLDKLRKRRDEGQPIG